MKNKRFEWRLTATTNKFPPSEMWFKAVEKMFAMDFSQEWTCSKMWELLSGVHMKNLASRCVDKCTRVCVRYNSNTETLACVFRWMSVLTSAGVVRGPVFAGHAHHLWALGLVSLLAADLTTRSHHVLIVLSSGCATAHVAMFHLYGCTPRCPYKLRKDGGIDLFFIA